LNSTVSVIVRTVRRPQRLCECLKSLAAQTFRNFELVLVDMSDDSVSTMVEKMPEIRLFLPVSLGASFVMNGGPDC
jgi:glycosyltransferase involved in cell wall biosynthesis